MYLCKICDRIYDSKYKYDRHINTHKSKKTEFVCNCGKIYKRQGHYKNHVSKCDFKKNLEKEQIVNQIINDNRVYNIQNINNIDNKKIVNNNVNNIQIKPVFQFNLSGSESIKHIDKEQLLEILNHNFSYAMRELMRLTFFNKDVPENNKWCVLYPKDEYGALTYNHKTESIERWITDQVVDDNFENMMFLISPVVDQIMEDKELTEKLNDKQKQNLNMFYNYFGIDKLSKENPSDFKNIKMMAYNNRVIPIDLWKNLDINY